MALVLLDISTYDTFRAAVIGRGFDVDGSFGYQCWDLGAELWGNTGNYIYPYLQTGPRGWASEIWTSSRDINATPDFDLIYRLQDVKRGDMIILGGTTLFPTGHNAFADEDYNGTTTMNIMGQNQRDANDTTGHVTTVDSRDVSGFLGAFRYKRWATPPPKPKTRKKGGFPWFMIARKLNVERNFVPR